MSSDEKTGEFETLYADLNNNYPLQCFLFDQDLDNYYQPSDPPLGLYLGCGEGNGDRNFNLHYFHDHHPQYHPHYLNYRHLMAQTSARYQTKILAPHLVHWIDVSKDDDDSASEVKRRYTEKTGMYLADGNVMVKYTTLPTFKTKMEVGSTEPADTTHACIGSVDDIRRSCACGGAYAQDNISEHVASRPSYPREIRERKHGESTEYQRLGAPPH